MKINKWKLTTLILSFCSVILSSWKWAYWSLYDVVFKTLEAPYYFKWTIVVVLLHIGLLVYASKE